MSVASFITILLVLLSGELLAGSLERDGVLRLYHSHLDKWTEVKYEEEGVVRAEGLKKINYFMRSRDSGKKHDINIKLIRLLDHLQDHFNADTVEIISGYRSPEFNRYLKMQGRSAVERSYHTQGMAADIHLDEITEKQIYNYAKRLRLGGVGYYPDNLMIHIDVGRVNSWQQGKFTNRRDIGIFNEDLNVSLITDRLFYFPGDKIRFEFTNPLSISLRPELKLEHFFRGKWGRVSFACHPEALAEGSPAYSRGILRCAQNDKPFSFKMFSYGKYRWKVSTEDGRVQYSNEFYLKKR